MDQSYCTALLEKEIFSPCEKVKGMIFFSPLKLLLLLFSLIFVLNFVRSASSSDEETDTLSVDLNHHSSDDEDSVNGHSDPVGLTDAFNSMNLTSEAVSRFHRELDAQLRIVGANGSEPLSCLDGSGREVDWWFVYKEPNGKRYLYLSSLDVKEAEINNSTAKFLRLRNKYEIDDLNTSPVLKTIYHPRNTADSSEVWIGWNDQPADGLDAYGSRVCGTKHAHSKGFYAQNAVAVSQNEVVIGSYAILTSLPQFPNIAQNQYALGESIKNSLPRDPKKIFGSNLESNAQHFMCLSFPRQKVQLETGRRNVKEVPLGFPSTHQNFLSKYLSTIHPAIVGTNFADRNPSHWLWRRYFSFLKYPYPMALDYLNHPNQSQKLLAYNEAAIPSVWYDVYRARAERPIFPLASIQFHRDKKGRIDYNPNWLVSHWDSRFYQENGCVNGNEITCLQSFTFTTTTLQSALNGNFFAKHCNTIMDLYDDWATLQVAEAQKHMEKYFAGETVDRYGLLVQSWIDTKTVLPRKPDKKIFNDQGKLVAKVHIDNLEHFYMPTSNYPLKVSTSHKDHSKWAISFALDTFNTDGTLEDNDASFNPLVFIGDLNRATTQARLKDKDQGRAGGIVAISSISLWHAFMDLNPRAYRQRFVTNGKHRTRQLQNRLRGHTSRLFCGMNSLPVDPLRKFTFKALRLSGKEAKKPVKPVKFIAVLNEISKFIKMAEFRPEHSAIAAFQRLFRNISEGKVVDAAKRAWDRTLKQINDRSRELFFRWPQLFSLPSLQLYREMPERDEEDIYYNADVEMNYLLINKETAEITSGDLYDCFSSRIKKLPRTKSTQTGDSEPENDGDDGDETVYPTEDEFEENSSDEDEEEEEEEEEDFTYERNSDSSEDHGTEYQDHINRYWRDEDGSDYDYGSGYESP